jgi:hypothetical protein
MTRDELLTVAVDIAAKVTDYYRLAEVIGVDRDKAKTTLDEECGRAQRSPTITMKQAIETASRRLRQA